MVDRIVVAEVGRAGCNGTILVAIPTHRRKGTNYE